MRRLFLIIALGMAACSGDSTGPDCALPKGCAIRGVDLAVVGATLDSSVSFRPVARAAGFHIRADVVNRGTRTSAPAVLRVTAWDTSATGAVPALAPGESARLLVPLALPRTYLVRGRDPAAITPVARLEHAGDADPSNDTLAGDDFTTDHGVVTLVGVPRPLQRVRAGSAVSISAVIGARGGYGRPAPQLRALFCVLSVSSGCDSVMRAPLQVRTITTGVEMVHTANVTLRSESLPAPGGPGLYRLAVCIIPAAAAPQLLDRSDPDHVCVDAGAVEVYS